MHKTFITLLLATILLSTVPASEAQQPAKIPLIGFQLDAPASAMTARTEAFRQGLRELGYIEGKNIIIEWRSAEGKPERRSELAAELVRLKVDAIVSAGPTVTRVVKEATSTIPIVMTLPSERNTWALLASQRYAAFFATVSKTGVRLVGELAMTPRISLVAVCCSAPWRSSRACMVIVFSCEAIVFSCVAIVFFSCERDSTRDAMGVTFDFFERFLGVVAIKETR